MRSVGSRMFQSRAARFCGYSCALVLGVAVAFVLVSWMLAAVAILFG